MTYIQYGAAPTPARYLGNFGGVADEDIQRGISAQFSTMQDNFGKIDKGMSYVEANQIKREVAKYDAWDSEWFFSGPNIVSSADITAGCNEIISQTAPEVREQRGVETAAARTSAPAPPSGGDAPIPAPEGIGGMTKLVIAGVVVAGLVGGYMFYAG